MLTVVSADLVVTAALSHLISQLFNTGGFTTTFTTKTHRMQTD